MKSITERPQGDPAATLRGMAQVRLPPLGTMSPKAEAHHGRDAEGTAKASSFQERLPDHTNSE